MAGEGEVTLTSVGVEGFETGVKVSKGMVMISGASTKITAKGQNAVGLQITGEGKAIVTGATITAEGDRAVGLQITGGKAEVTGATIKGNGGRSGTSKGVVVDTLSEEGVKLTNVTIESFATGMEVKKGTVKISGESKIAGISTGLSVQGGTVTMTRGTISEGGVYMSGGTLMLEGVTVSGNNGVRMSGGTFKMIRGKITGSETSTGVDMSGKGEVTLEEVDISEVTMGVQMLGGKKLTMERGSITVVENGVGVSVEGGEEVTVNLDGTKITGSGTSRNGVYVGSSVTGAVTLKDVMISQVRKGVEVKGGATASLTLTDVMVSGVQMGVSMMGGKSLTMTKGSIGFTRSYGVYVGGEMTAKLTKTVITGSGGGNGGTGVYATGGEVTLTDVTISQVGTGVDISGGKSLTMKDGMIKEFTTAGVSVGRFATRADLTGTIITGKGSGTGVKVEDKRTSANLTLTNVTVSEVATGVEMNGAGALTVKGGTIKGVQTGIDMSGSGALMISGSSTIEFTSDNGYGVYVGKDVTRATLTGTRIMGRGSGTGVYVKGGNVTLALTDVTVSGIETGVEMNGTGALMISGSSTIQFTGEYGVKVGKGVTRADLTETKIRGKGGGTGVYVAHEGKVAMALTDVNISEVTTGLYMMGNGALTVSGNSTTINFAGGMGSMWEVL
ncbi:Right handed beta helix region [Bartonella sp. WD12.1]|nr:Right handed beta helix region [Bartonella sp. WD12.1]